MPCCRMRNERTLAFTLIELILVLAVLAVIAAFFLPAVTRSREAARRTQCRNNLKQIGLALHSYHDEWQAFPPAYTVDENGKPLHSWRTLILPYLDHAPLYKRLDLSKPWNDPLNVAVFEAPVPVYSCPSSLAQKGHTGYLAIVTDRSVIRRSASATIADIKDGTSNTVIIIEVDATHSVPWMSPQDADESVAFSFRDPKNKDSHIGGAHTLAANGTVKYLGEKIDVNVARGLVTIDGGETLDDF